MDNKEDVVKIIKDSINDLEKKVSLYDDYMNNEKKIKCKRKIVYYLECILPYIIASFIGNSVLHHFGHSIYTLDEIKYYENVQRNICSNGLEDVNRSNKKTFSNSFFTSTPWEIDEFGNYVREEVYYSLDALEDYDLYELLAMSDESLKKLFPVVNHKKYIQNTLSEEDLKYDDNLVFISITNREYIEDFDRIQTRTENLLDIVICLIITIVCGVSISSIVVRHRITDKMNAYIDEIKKINIKEYKELLKIRQDNLELLVDENEKRLKRGSNEHGVFHFTR